MGIIVGSVGGPLTFSSANGGKVYGYNNISEFAPITVVQINPARQRIRFHNPGTQDIFIAPLFVQNVLGTATSQPSNVALLPNNVALGGCIRLFGNGGTLDITGECQGAWQAFAVANAGATNSLTVIDSNT